MADNKNDFTQGRIVSKLLTFMIPIFGALVLQAMYGAVDLLVVGRFGTTAGISGVSTGSNIVNLVTFTITGLTMGVTVVMGQYMGEKKPEKAGRVVGGAICLFVVLSFILAVVMLAFARPFAVLMQAPEEALDLTVLYVRICGGGIFFIIAYNVISSIFRGIGDSNMPLVLVGIACVVKIIGDLLFVAVFGWNVAGAALATVMAQAVSVVLSLIIIRKRELPFTLKREDIRFHAEIKKFVQVGTPIAFQEILTQMSFLALCAFINRLGLDASSGYGVANKIVSFVMLVPGSLMQSMASFVAQNVGAGHEKRARKAMVTGMLIGCGVGVFIMAFAFFRGGSAGGHFLQRCGGDCPGSAVFEGLCTRGGRDGDPVQFYRVLQRTFQNPVCDAAGTRADLYGTSAYVLFYEHSAGRKPYHDRPGGALCNGVRNCDQSALLCKAEPGHEAARERLADILHP